MRPLTFSPDSLRKLLLHDQIATLPDLKRALGTDVDLTVFRKLQQLDYLTSYSRARCLAPSRPAKEDCP
jgi:hypothetical protein